MASVSQGSHHGSPTNASRNPQASDLPIETLIDHLLNAKKALNSIDTLWRANDIVSTAQTALEESVIISARTGFLRRGITQQVRLLEKTRNGLEQIKRDGDAEFTVSLSMSLARYAGRSITLAIHHRAVHKLTTVIGYRQITRRSRQTSQKHNENPR